MESKVDVVSISFLSNQIKLICSKVDLDGIRNVKKGEMIDASKDGFQDWKTIIKEAKKKDVESISNP